MLLSRVAVGCSITLACGLGAAMLAARAPHSGDVTAVAIVPIPVPVVPAAVPSRTPTRVVPCAGDGRPELATDGEQVIACWDDDCRAYGNHHVASPVARPAAAPAVQAKPVDAQHFGPALERAIAARPDTEVEASDDGAIVLVGDGSPFRRTAWNVAADHPIALPPAAPGDSALTELYILGNELLVSRGCGEWCNSDGTIVDAHGRVLARSLDVALNFGSGTAVRIGDDAFVLQGEFGELTWIDHGREMATGVVISSPARPRSIRVSLVPMTASSLAIEVCQDSGCLLGTVQLADDEYGGKHDREVRVWLDAATLPACTDA